ncbi:phosphatidate cytidylyltransferase family protein [Wolffia australiana]
MERGVDIRRLICSDLGPIAVCGIHGGSSIRSTVSVKFLLSSRVEPPRSIAFRRSLFHSKRRLIAPMAFISIQDGTARDVVSTLFTSGVAVSLLQFWGELAKRGVFDQALSRKLVHISVGLTFIIFWPMFSDSKLAPLLAAVPAAANAVRMILIGRGIWRNEAIVKSMSRYGDHRELLRGPLFYACTITLASVVYWRTSPIAVAAVCNLCAGDGVADVVGRRFGRVKLPYNPGKSFAGSLAMAAAGFVTSVGYMCYFSLFGLIEPTWGKVLGFLIVSVAATIIESLPISTKLDDNLTVPLTSFLVGSLVF